MDKRYKHKEIEEKWYKFWEESGLFKPKINPKKKPFIMTMAPPNVTGELHLGHALENTCTDVLIRRSRMQNIPTLWISGTDHAGIATQNMVEKELVKENKTRFDLGRERFEKKLWQWVEKYGNIIISQLKTLGCSADWTRQRFTMDKEYKKAVEEAFNHYYQKGLIYRGERTINWCPRCQTSLSDLEIEYKESASKLWHIKYGPLIVATTRPETMLGDTALAVNPKDKRYQNFVGQKINLPLANRQIPVIEDESIDSNFGTGVLKVTPAHDFKDFEIGERHNLPKIKVINEEGKMTDKAGNYAGLDRFEARKKVLASLEKADLLVKTENYTYLIPTCYRCETIVEPLLSKQWFLSMKELAKSAIEVVKKGQIKFIPQNFTKVYLDWLENIRDWCISRQIWWGHKIPIEGETDVLDTWFSSALWPFATLGWPKKTRDLEYFYPTTILTNAREIIFLWDARMIFASLELTGKIPFQTIYIHPTIQTKEGKRMSKSLGTGLDPLVLIERYGADAVRFGLMYQNTGVQDIRFSEEAIITGRNFCNKIWNAARFVLQEKAKSNKQKAISKNKDDRWILEELKKTVKQVDSDLDKFRFGQATHTLYDFFWHKFCDVYLEKTKNHRNEAQPVLLEVLEKSLKLLHPFMPFITEEIYQKLPGRGESIMVEEWPR